MKRLAVAGALKLSAYLKNRIKPEVFDRYSRILTSDCKKEEIDRLEDVGRLDPNLVTDYRIGLVLNRTAENPIARTLVELAALCYLHKEALELIDLVVPTGHAAERDGITIEAAMLVSGIKGELSDHVEEIYDAYDLAGVLLDYRETTSDPAREIFRWDFRLTEYYGGGDVPDLKLIKNIELTSSEEESALYGYRKKLSEFADFLQNIYDEIGKNHAEPETQMTLVISGEKESGRLTSAKWLAHRLGTNMVSVSWEFLRSQDDPKYILIKVVREAMLLEAALCIRNIDQQKDTELILNEIRQYADIFGCRPLILLADDKVKPMTFLKGRIFTFRIPEMDAGMRLLAWDGFAAEYGIRSAIDAKALMSKMRLTTGQIKRLVIRITGAESGGQKITMKDVYGFCYEILDDGRYENIKRVKSGFTLDDLKITEQNREILKDIVGQVNGRLKVLDEWNMGSKYTYGKCVSVILAGPPGTGKTMAVHALANELGLELYKVDLSQIADKYIGETEKRLEEVFDKADKCNMILFFDEADAVMGKRSETKDAHDKYANNEIAFILQRIEEYDGIVILATNYLQNVDSAFMRRIRYVVNVGMPQAETRKEIWKNAFAPEVPLSADIDFDYLAENFEISGGNIKNIVLNAVFYAANEDSPVTMYHIMKAVFLEDTKDKHGVVTKDYGKYGYLVKSFHTVSGNSED